MTTIAFDGRYIACDSRITNNGNFIVSDSREKFVVLDDWVIFWCGAVNECEEFIDAFLNGKPVDKDINVGLHAYEKKTKLVYEASSVDVKIWKAVILDKKSCGSGADHAITAMDCGKNAVESVRLAAKRDPFTGGIIRCFDTATGKFIKVKQ